MARYLLDTDVVSDLARHPTGRVFERIRLVGPSSVCTSIIVAAELRFGVAKKRSARLTNRVVQVLASLDILPLEGSVDTVYGDLRTRLEAAGRPIGSNDLLIAAHAVATGCVVATGNMSEFGRIEQLRVENWLAPN